MLQPIIHLGYRDRLFQELQTRQRRNPAYSLRGFARDLGLSASTLSQLFHGKRNLSARTLKKVSHQLHFAPLELRSALQEIKPGPSALSDDNYLALSNDVFRSMADWYYFALLSLARSQIARANPTWLARRLQLPVAQIKDALLRLQRLGLIRVEKGRLVPSGQDLRVPSDVPSAAARHLQQNHLELAQASLRQHKIEERDMTSMTMLARADRLPEAKKRITKFRRQLSRFLEAGGQGDQVYVLALQLFPLTDRLPETPPRKNRA